VEGGAGRRHGSPAEGRQEKEEWAREERREREMEREEKEEGRSIWEEECGQDERLMDGWEVVLLALARTQHTWAVWRAEHNARSLHCEG
jgi:hypothetical protein